MRQAQESQRAVYNKQAKLREFKPGDRVLIPTTESKLLVRWQGPYKRLEKIGDANYKVQQPRFRHPVQLYHVNLLKSWKYQEVMMVTAKGSELHDWLVGQPK